MSLGLRTDILTSVINLFAVKWYGESEFVSIGVSFPHIMVLTYSSGLLLERFS
jgi:hypothetical protein